MANAVRCWDCDKIFGPDDLRPRNVEVLPGSIVPSGVCPDEGCNGDCYPVGDLLPVYIVAERARALCDVLSRCKLPKDMTEFEKDALHGLRKEVAKMRDANAEVILSGLGDDKGPVGVEHE